MNDPEIKLPPCKHTNFTGTVTVATMGALKCPLCEKEEMHAAMTQAVGMLERVKRLLPGEQEAEVELLLLGLRKFSP